MSCGNAKIAAWTASMRGSSSPRAASADAEPVQPGVVVGEQQVVLGREVPVERADGDAGVRGDLLDRRRLDALAHEPGQRGPAQRGPGPRAADGLRSRPCGTVPDASSSVTVDKTPTRRDSRRDRSRRPPRSRRRRRLARAARQPAGRRRVAVGPSFRGSRRRTSASASSVPSATASTTSSSRTTAPTAAATPSGPGSWRTSSSRSSTTPRRVGRPGLHLDQRVILPLFTIVDGYRRGLRKPWLFFVATLFTSCTFGLCLYLYVAERTRRHGPGARRSRRRPPSGACQSRTLGVGLRGLEPLTSSLSGKRSNRLSYRPAASRTSGDARGNVTGGMAAPEVGNDAHLSSASVTSMPPSSEADML